MKTILLENDEWFRKGQEDWCKSFDPSFVTIQSDTKTKFWDLNSDMYLAMLLSQPNVERVLCDSSYDSLACWEFSKKHDQRDDNVYQLEEFAAIILQVVRFRKQNKLKPLTIELNYLGEDFAKRLVEDNWGNECSRLIQLIVGQNPDSLIVNVYEEYKFKYRLTEELFDSLQS